MATVVKLMRQCLNLSWLLAGDVSIQFQVHRDLLGVIKPDLQKRIASQDWGAQLMHARHQNGHWGQKFYQPKWISTHYTLLDLKHLCFPQNHKLIQASLAPGDDTFDQF